MEDVMASIAGLTPAEKFELLGRLWDDLSATPAEIPIPDWQKEELDRRKADLLQNPDSVITEEELKSRLRERRGR